MRMSCINFNIDPKRNMGPKDFNNAGSTEASFFGSGRKSTWPEPFNCARACVGTLNKKK